MSQTRNEHEKKWTDADLMARYRQGREDAGDKSGAFYREEDLREAFEKGSELSDRLNGIALRNGFEEGFKEGQETGKGIGAQLQQQTLNIQLSEAERKAQDEGYRRGIVAGHYESFHEGYKTAREQQAEEIENQRNELARERQNIQQQAVEEYKQSQQAGFVERYFTSSSLRYLNKLPLGSVEQQVNRHIYGSIYETEKTPIPLRVSDFRIRPALVMARFACYYILSPLIASTAAYHSLKLYNESKEHGETFAQLKTRRKVEADCQKLENITPQYFELQEFNESQNKQIEDCKQACHEAESYHENMKKIMRLRRVSKIDNPIYFGPRVHGGYNDKKNPEVAGAYIADAGVSKKIDALYKEFINDGIKTYSNNTESKPDNNPTIASVKEHSLLARNNLLIKWSLFMPLSFGMSKNKCEPDMSLTPMLKNN